MSDSPLPNEGDKNAPADAEVTTPATPPEPAAAPAPEVAPEAESAPAPEAPPNNPNITCKRCGTVTNWNPYCPTCGAYLEFMGVPSWSPTEVTSTVPEPKPPAPEPIEPAVVVEPAETPTPDASSEAEPLPADAPRHRFHGLHLGHHQDDAADDDAVDDGAVDDDSAIWKRLKVVFLGNGRSGKTSILRAMAKKPLQLDQQSTRGVTVDAFAEDLKPGFGRKWRHGFDLELSFWDFAGQLEYSAAHDFFLSSRQAVYVIVFSVVDDRDSQIHQVA